MKSLIVLARIPPCPCRGPRGPCGLKLQRMGKCKRMPDCRGPRGPCGLKFHWHFLALLLPVSRPARALWIEIPGMNITICSRVSRPARALWIEILKVTDLKKLFKSRPARALWIEITAIAYVILTARCRGPRGPCGLKYPGSKIFHIPQCRGPRGPCGLKSFGKDWTKRQ